MNLNLLKKLTKLANHNPNEHEANSAARRVCKMLEESDWKVIPEIKTAAGKITPDMQGSWHVKKPESPTSGFRPDQQYYDEMRNMTEDMFRKMQEEMRNRQYSRPANPFRNMRYEGVDWGKEPPRSSPYGTEPPINRQQDEILREARKRRGFDPDGKKEMRVCSKCGESKMTGFLTGTFICTTCRLKEL
jgi:hypothetical protein